MNRYLVLNVLVAGLLNTMQVFSQNAINPESEYLRVKTIAFDGDYATAAAAARKLVNMYPSYGDARILLGRILAWQKDYINAGAVIDTLLLKEPDNEDALSARRNILMWSKADTPAVSYTHLRAHET